MGRDLTYAEETELEILIDSAGLCAVLQSLSSICGAKADHILVNYTDHARNPLARAWRNAEGKLGVTACSPFITVIGEP